MEGSNLSSLMIILNLFCGHRLPMILSVSAFQRSNLLRHHTWEAI